METRIQARHLLTHPFYQAWSAGTLSRQALQEYSKQYYRQVEAFPTYISAVHSNCPSLAVRQHLLENLIEEERGAENHPALWLRFAEALGVSRTQVLGAPLLPETAAAIRMFRTLTRDRSYVAGLAALFAYEAQVPAVATAKIAGLEHFYGITEPQAIAFFTVHQEADRRHAETTRRLLHDHLTQENAGEALAACDRALEALWILLDGVYKVSC
ncbi:MAG: CADD family putative folate metabolism protein [Candidatus Binatia bacterium]|nr:CADD family putative folate metabolism protein [Candidatus Binatia bacterium]